MLTATEFEQVTQIKMNRYTEFNPGYSVSVYLVDGLLIDSGQAHTAEELTEFLKDKEIRIVVNTHYHEDHISANALLKERYGVELLAHPLAINRINQPATLYPYQEEVWGYPIPTQVKDIGDSVTTPHFRFEVIHTPGHTCDHICLFERSKGWLFSGDLFITTRPTVVRIEENQWQAIASLNKVKDLMPRVLFPAAGTKIVTDPLATLEQTIQYLEDLGHKVTDLSDKGLSPGEIRQQIFGDETRLVRSTQQLVSSENLVKSYLK
ncbi:MAG: MBL fold metallo-hydrolase, partial [Dehalococcoidia bacterium]|nr:MBL fold metallo-hydrolase [Dehalococcoidia bacterium]